MRKIVFIQLLCLLWTCCSCNRTEVDTQDSSVVLKEGEEKIVKIDQESLAFSFVEVTPIFMEGVVEDNSTTMHQVYDATITIDKENLTFRTYITSTLGQVRNEKSWEQLQKTPEGIKNYKSYQIGVSDIISESGAGSGDTYTIKVLVRK